MEHPLAHLLTEVAAGKFPPPDGGVTVMSPPDDRLSGVLAFTGHHVVAADVSPEWVRSRLRPGDLSALLNPPFLAALTEFTGRRVGSIDAVMVAPPTTDPSADPSADRATDRATDQQEPELILHPADGVDHGRLAMAQRYRTGVRAWQCDGGLVVLGRGLAGRWEVAVEVDRRARGRGLGRRLFAIARRLVDGAVWAQVAPGNVASMRALLEAGYRPGGAEALLVRS